MLQRQRRILGVPPLGFAAAIAVALTMLGASLVVDRWLASLGDQWTRNQLESSSLRAANQIEQEFVQRERFAAAWVHEWGDHGHKWEADPVTFFAALQGTGTETLFSHAFLYDRLRSSDSHEIFPDIATPLDPAHLALIPGIEAAFAPGVATAPLEPVWILPSDAKGSQMAWRVSPLEEGRFLVAGFPLAARSERLLASYQNEQIGTELVYGQRRVAGSANGADEARGASVTLPIRAGRMGSIPLELTLYSSAARESSLLSSVRRIIVAGGVMLALALGSLTIGWARSSTLFSVTKRKHRLIHDRSPLYYHAVGLDWRVRDVNLTECEALGYPYEVLVGMPISEISPEGAALIEDLDKSGAVTSQQANVTYRTRTGELRDVAVTVLLDREEEKGETRWLMLAQDVTEHLRAERENLVSQQRLQQLTHAVESLEEGLLLLDGEGRVSHTNPAAKRLLDPTERGLDGLAVSELIPPSPSEPDAWKAIREAVANGLPWSREIRPQAGSPANMVIAITFAGESRDESGTSSLLLLARDITRERALRERLESSQRKYQTIFDQAPTGILAIDRMGNLLDANPFYRHVIAPLLATPTDTGGFSLIRHEAFVRAGAADALNTLNSGGEVMLDSVPVFDEEGSLLVALSLRGIPESDSDGRIRRSFLFVEDVTSAYALRLQQERRASDLEDEKDRALEASRLKSQFLATISHELRTPLNAIIGFSQIVARKSAEALEPRQLENVRKIEDSGLKLLRLVNDLLDISRIEAGHVEIKYENIELDAFLASLRDEVAPLMEPNGNTLVFDVPSGIGRMETDAFRLHQVLLNLLGNAAKFTHGGTVRLFLEVSRSGPEGAEWLSFTVEDTGPGIPDDKKDAIFEEFYQVDGSSTRRYAGTGLGLAISRRLVLIMDGEIRVESEEGKGARFIVKLPRSRHRRSSSHESITRLLFP
ncbi:MAG: hypothetical protein PWP23_1594 [Candidatus Sumerlaeota bacterium]|nr:hypothetical protein [Candidatus Sumerlaeota bacterium]